MNFKKMFAYQKAYDNNLSQKMKVESTDLLSKKMLALTVELGKLADEWQGHKYWSLDTSPRTDYICSLCEGAGEISAETDSGSSGEYREVDCVFDVDITCPLCESEAENKNPLLDRYVSSFRLIVSIGLEFNFDVYTALKPTKSSHSVLSQFNLVFDDIATFRGVSSMGAMGAYEMIFNDFLELGRLLELAEDEVIESFLSGATLPSYACSY